MSLDDAFGVEPIQGDLITVNGDVVPPNNSLQENIDYDYEKTRDNLHTLLEQGKGALERAIDVAMGSEHPRAFEVVGNLLKQMADMNHQLLELSEKRIKISKPSEEKQVTNNAFFIGSTSELNKLIKELKK